MTEKMSQDDRIPILKASQHHSKASDLLCHIVFVDAASFLGWFVRYVSHGRYRYSVVMPPVSHVLVNNNNSFCALQEFIALCEVLELIPEDELELSRQEQPDTMANRRAQKVRPNYIFSPSTC